MERRKRSKSEYSEPLLIIGDVLDKFQIQLCGSYLSFVVNYVFIVVIKLVS